MKRDLDEAAAELLRARRAAGLTLQVVADALNVAHTTVQRTEHGHGGMSLMLLARHAAVLGMRARIRIYPDGNAIRDAAQVSLIRRFRERIGNPGAWAFEVPIPIPGDQRALDAVLTLPAGRIGLEFITRMADAQAQLRAANLKRRDAALDRVVVVVQATHANRRALREAGVALAEFPGSSRRLLATLSAGQMPGTDGVILF